MSRRKSFNAGASLQAQARAFEAILTPLARMIDYAFGLGANTLKEQYETRRIQLTETRIMREVGKEQREQALFMAKMAQMENTIARQSLEIDRLRKNMGLDAPTFEAKGYDY